MDDGRPIGIISLGVERDILFRPKDLDSHVEEPVESVWGVNVEPTRLTLGHGSLCLMAPGMQDTWEHRIPKSSRICGERISLTFRGYVHQ